MDLRVQTVMGGARGARPYDSAAGGGTPRVVTGLLVMGGLSVMDSDDESIAR